MSYSDRSDIQQSPLRRSSPQQSLHQQALVQQPALNFCKADRAGPRSDSTASQSAGARLVEEYAGELIKTAGLLIPGKAGLSAAVASYMVDACLNEGTDKDRETGETDMASRLALAAARGAFTKVLFMKFAELDPASKLLPSVARFDAGGRSVLLGAASRAIDLTLDERSWTGSADPPESPEAIGWRALQITSKALNPAAISADLLAFGICSDKISGFVAGKRAALDRNPLLANALMGAGFGFSRKAAGELCSDSRTSKANTPYAVLTDSLTAACLGAIASVPGGMMYERRAAALGDELRLVAAPTKELKPCGQGRSPASAAPANSAATEAASGSKSEAGSGSEAESEAEAKADPPLPFAFNAPPEETLEALAARISHWDIRHEPCLELSNTNVDNFRSEREYLYRGVSLIRHPVVYAYPRDHRAAIAVPLSYERKLFQIRAAGAGGRTESVPASIAHYATRALPENIVQRLDELPNSTLVKRINLLDLRHPKDIWRTANGRRGKILANAGVDGSINLFRAESEPTQLRAVLNHEWAHILHNERPKELKVYESAARIEDAYSEKGYNRLAYARLNERENWAVNLGECMLEPQAENFLSLAKNAPIRSVVLARALKWSLTEAPQAQVSLFKTPLLRRVDFIENHVKPYAQREIISRLAEEPGEAGEWQETRDLLTLAQYLDARPPLSQLEKLELRNTDTKIGSQIADLKNRFYRSAGNHNRNRSWAKY